MGTLPRRVATKSNYELNYHITVGIVSLDWVQTLFVRTSHHSRFARFFFTFVPVLQIRKTNRSPGKKNRNLNISLTFLCAGVQVASHGQARFAYEEAEGVSYC